MKIEDLRAYDFLDFGASSGGSIDFARERLGGRRGLGIDLSEQKVKFMRQLGYDCLQADVLKLDLPPKSVKFVTLFHFLEHLPGREAVRGAVKSGAEVATDYLAIRGPFFDADEYLKGLGLKFYWSDWTGHPCHLSTELLRGVLSELGLTDFQFAYRTPVKDAGDPALLPLDAPSDQHRYDPQVHSEKPFRAFDRPVYAELVCLVKLRPGARGEEFLKALAPGGESRWRLTWLPRNIRRCSRYLFRRRRRPLASLAAQLAEVVAKQGPGEGLRRTRDHINRLLATPLQTDWPAPGFCLLITASPATEHSYSSGGYRCLHPADLLLEMGLPARTGVYEQVDLVRSLEYFDCFVLHRLPWDGEVEHFIRRARALGKPVLYDADDLVFAPQALPFIREREGMPAAKRALFDEYTARRARALALCDAAMVATEPLAEWVRKLFPGKPVFVNRNTVSRAMFGFSEDTSEAKSAPPLLSYFSGTRSHDWDFRECAEPLARVLEARPQTRLMLIGPLDVPPRILAFKDRLRRIPLRPWRTLPDLHRATWINLAPLEKDNPFTACKSALKYFEAGLFAVPTVASHNPAFDSDIRDGENGFLCRDAGEWEAKLLRLIDDSELRRRMGRAARAQVMEEYAPQARAANLERILGEVLGPERFQRIREKFRGVKTE